MIGRLFFYPARVATRGSERRGLEGPKMHNSHYANDLQVESTCSFWSSEMNAVCMA